MLAAVLIVALIEAVVAQIVEIGVVLVVIVFSFGFTFFLSSPGFSNGGTLEQSTLRTLWKIRGRNPPTLGQEVRPSTD